MERRVGGASAEVRLQGQNPKRTMDDELGVPSLLNNKLTVKNGKSSASNITMENPVSLINQHLAIENGR